MKIRLREWDVRIVLSSGEGKNLEADRNQTDPHSLELAMDVYEIGH